MMRSKKWKRFAAVLCTVIFISYAFVIFIPHTHECVGMDCSVCALAETSRNILIGIALTGATRQLANTALVGPNASYFPFCGNNETLVALKVKLSD